MIFQDQLNIYDIRNPLKSISVTLNNSSNSLLENSQTIMPLKKEFFVDVRNSQEKIFALYVNQNRKEWATGDKPAQILVFDWSGNPICKLETKEKIIRIDIDSKKNQLYGLSEKQEIILYDLNNIVELK